MERGGVSILIAPRQEWLALTVEKAVEPDLPICDPHHHLWEHPDDHYLLEDLLADIRAGHNIVKTVYVECMSGYRESGPLEMRPVGETEFARAVAARGESGENRMAGVAAGIVGFADLTLGKAVAPVLEAHLAAGQGRFRGIRHSCVWDRSPDITKYMNPPRGQLLNPVFQEGLGCLQKYGLSFEAWVYFHQLMELVKVVRAFPETVFVLNHIGGLLGVGPYAGKREEVFQEWQRGITALASCPNVAVKLGGLGMQRCGFGWYDRVTPPSSVEVAEAISPYYLHCIEQFGVERCMFESNFPVDKVSYSYTVMWNAFKHMTRDFSPEERSALFYDTAVRVYRLPSE